MNANQELARIHRMHATDARNQAREAAANADRVAQDADNAPSAMAASLARLAQSYANAAQAHLITAAAQAEAALLLDPNDEGPRAQEIANHAAQYADSAQDAADFAEVVTYE